MLHQTFELGFGADRIADFSRAQGDRLHFVSGAGDALPDSYAELMARGAQVGANAVFSFSDGSSLTLTGVSLASITAADVIFG